MYNKIVKKLRNSNLKKITLKRQRFIDYYDGNAAETAIKAGYKKKHADITGCKLLKIPEIKEAIKKREETNPAKISNILNREGRQGFWTTVLNDPEVEMKDRLRASELLGRSCGDFFDRVKIEVGTALDDFTPDELSRISAGEDTPAGIIAKRGAIEIEYKENGNENDR